MTEWAIKVDGLGKHYRLGQDVSRHRLAGIFMPWRQDAKALEFWALRNISFKIAKGETVGIVGRNGAGKSTLLKLLSRITAPTEGRILIDGKVGTLLEVGTGFHQELSGRENIYLSGSILGLSRTEIKSKFDEIVEFSEVGKFIDTPVKRYSSGMQVRLAFSVALYLDPEILIIDEVLAVGDLGFQRKSVGKLRSASSDHRTVLFVSHSLDAVKRLCPRVIVLDGGEIKYDGPADEALAYYRDSVSVDTAPLQSEALADKPAPSELTARFIKVDLFDARGKNNWSLDAGETACFRYEFEILKPIRNLTFLFRLLAKNPELGTTEDIITDAYGVVSQGPLPAGYRGVIELDFPNLPLNAGEVWPYARLGDVADSVSYAEMAGPQALSVTPDGVGRYDHVGVVSIDYEFRHFVGPGALTVAAPNLTLA